MNGKKYDKYKWITLIIFALMYNLVYLGRFSVNNLIDNFNSELTFTESQTTFITVSVFISYAVGSIVNGMFVDRYSAKKGIVVGGIATSILNIVIVYLNNWLSIFICCLLNGFFQSIIWVGGISIIAQWWQEKDWGKSVGIANFFSGLSHLMAYILPMAVGLVLPGLNWRYQIIVPIMMLAVFVIIFAYIAKEKPQSVGLEPYELEDSQRKTNARFLTSRSWSIKTLTMYIISKKSFGWWCLIAFASSVCRYGLFEWGTQYFADKGNLGIQPQMFTEVTLPIGMAFGTLIITWITGVRFLDNKGLMVTSMAAICGSMVIVFPFMNNTQSIMTGIFLMGFALYGVNGILWLHAIDQGGRVYAGTIAGLLNGCAYFGATIQGLFFSTFVDLFDSYIVVFVLIEIICVVMIICGIMICRKQLGRQISEY